MIAGQRTEEIKARVGAQDRSVGGDTTKVISKDILWGLKAVNERKLYAGAHRSYYKGKQRQMIRSERLRTVFGVLFKEFNLNMCKTVVDALADRLVVQSFSTEEGDKKLAEKAWKIWEANRMQMRASQMFLEAVAAGDVYLLVWPNTKDPDKAPVIYPQMAHEMAVEYDTDLPGKINKAVKVWYTTHVVGNETKKRCNVNLYYADRIERFIADMPESGDAKPENFKHRPASEADANSWITYHKWGQVPVFHLANSADLGQYGESELEQAVKVQDMANYLVFSLLVGVEFAAMPQKYIMNIEKPQDPETGEYVDPLKSGPEHIWTLQSPRGEGMPQGQVGVIPAADLDKLTNVMDFADRKMAQITGTPMHYFFMETGQAATPASGESQKIAEFKLDKKVENRQTAWGDVLAKAMTLAVEMWDTDSNDEGGIDREQADTSRAGQSDEQDVADTSAGSAGDKGSGDAGATADSAELEIGTNWADTRPKNELEGWTIAGLKRTAGVSQKQILREMGYTEKQIKEMEKENKEAAEAFGLGGMAFGSAQDQAATGGASAGGKDPVNEQLDKDEQKKQQGAK